MQEKPNEEGHPTLSQLRSIGDSLKPELDVALNDAGIEGQVEYEVSDNRNESESHPSLKMHVHVHSPERVERAVKEIRKTVVAVIESRVEGFDVPVFELACRIPSGVLPSDWDDAAFSETTILVTVSGLPYASDPPVTLPFRTKVEPIMAPPTDSSKPVSTVLLSGGGYRATAFHIGVLRWLYEHSATDKGDSALSMITRVVGISGGSITAAHFVKNHAKYVQSFDKAQELIEFIQGTDLRNSALEKRVAVSESLKNLLGEKDRFPNGDCKLDILGTSLRTGDCFVFSDTNVRRLAIDGRTNHAEKIGNCKCLLRNAVAASAAFPPVLRPFVPSKDSLGAAQEKDVGEIINDEIADGGIRDNTGIEYAKTQSWGKDVSQILVSDAGRPFDWTPPEPSEKESIQVWGKRMARVVDIISNRVAVLLESAAPGVRKVAMSDTAHASQNEDALKSYMQRLTYDVAIQVLKISTDLKPLSGSQLFALIRHGYDTTGSVLTPIYPFQSDRATDGEEFWKKLWPAMTERRLSSTKDGQDLLGLDLIQSNKKSSEEFDDLSTAASELPASDTSRSLVSTAAWCAKNKVKTSVVLIAAFALYTAFVWWFFCGSKTTNDNLIGSFHKGSSPGMISLPGQVTFVLKEEDHILETTDPVELEPTDTSEFPLKTTPIKGFVSRFIKIPGEWLLRVSPLPNLNSPVGAVDTSSKATEIKKGYRGKVDVKLATTYEVQMKLLPYLLRHGAVATDGSGEESRLQPQ